MVIEGSRGVGTTSFGNFVRFKVEEAKHYFTPISEIGVEPTWNADTLMAAIIANIVSTLELQHLDAVKNKKEFKEGKAIVQRVTEIYHSFGLINNLDIGVVQNEAHIKVLLNIMRDYFQMAGTSWLLVGDTSLRRFIAQEVYRVDDIVAHETEIMP